MREAPYETEAVLQDLLEQHPEVLASEDMGEAPLSWVLVRREATVALGDTEAVRGSLDHLFLDGDGVPTLGCQDPARLVRGALLAACRRPRARAASSVSGA